MTYNIRYDSKNDSLDYWNDRKADVVQMVQRYKPSFMGIQEGRPHQVTYLDDKLKSYAYIGVGRDDGQQKGEYSAIFYDTTKFKVLESNTFWLSKTPEKVSVGWDAAMERICTYGLFENIETKKQLWVFNTHFDHIGVKARKKSAGLILKKIRQINTTKLPVVLMGDFNLEPTEKPILLIKKAMDDAMEITQTPMKGPKGTFNGFDITTIPERRIDYIFLKGLQVASFAHLDDRRENGRYISDHLPVLITLGQ